MSIAFYVRRFLLAFVIAAIVICLAQYLKGHTLEFSLREGLIWGVISSAVYTGVLAYKLRHLPAPPE
jgi:hypothetical protein